MNRVVPLQLFRFRNHRRRPRTPAAAAARRVRFLPLYNINSSSVSSSSGAMSSSEPGSAAVPRSVLVFAALSVSCLLLYGAADSLRLLPYPSASSISFPKIFPSVLLEKGDSNVLSEEQKLEKILKEASMKDGTVILTTLNEAWAAPNTVFDLFLESFRIGERTRNLLNHLVIVALDHPAYMRCLQLHTQCFALVTDGVDFHKEAYFMTPSYLKMMWRRIDFLRSVLEMGYNFVFTDADIMWFRDPFPRFYVDADFQIACDHFLGSSFDIHNIPNGGFNHVKSNNRSIEFYKFWYSARERYPGYHDQDVLNFIKLDAFVQNLGLKMRFLDTAYFGGLCEPSKDLNLVCTMHANCCIGLDSKLHDLRIMLQDWRNFLSLLVLIMSRLLLNQLHRNLLSFQSIDWILFSVHSSLDSLRHYYHSENSIKQEVQE